MDTQTFIYNVAKCLPGLLIAIIIHEVAHAYIALRFGDDTAKRSGRISLNPAVHFDLMGTVIFPLVGIMAYGSAFGWAKPVPIDTRNFSNFRKGLFWVSFAGPLANFIVGTLSALLYCLIDLKTDGSFAFRSQLLEMLNYSILINFILGGFNMIPLPPLDGSKMVAACLKNNALRKFEDFAAYGNYILWGLILLSVAGVPVFNYILFPFRVMAGVSLSLFYSLFG